MLNRFLTKTGCRLAQAWATSSTFSKRFSSSDDGEPPFNKREMA